MKRPAVDRAAARAEVLALLEDAPAPLAVVRFTAEVVVRLPAHVAAAGEGEAWLVRLDQLIDQSHDDQGVTA